MASDQSQDLTDYLMLREDLGHLSVVPTLDGKKWRVSFKRQGDKEYVVHEHGNIVTAMLLALSPQKGETVEGLTNDINDWIATLAEAERRRKQPYPHQTIEELVEKLPENKKVRRRERTTRPKNDGYDLI